MSDDVAEYPILDDLSEAFGAAVAAFLNWEGGPEPEVSFRLKPRPISAICDFVTNFNDEMPGDLYRLLCARTKLGAELQDKSYGGAARGFLRLISAQSTRYQDEIAS